MSDEQKQEHEAPASPEERREDDAPASAGRRDAVAKLAYASPVVAGLLFSKRAAAFSPPAPPGG